MRARAGIIGPVLFFLAIVIGGSMEPGYDHSRRFVSELAVTGTKSTEVMTLGFLAYGFCQLLAAGPIQKAIGAGVLVWLVLVGAGVGTIGAGAFRCSPGCPQPVGETDDPVLAANAAHAFFANVMVLGWMLAAGFTAWRLRASHDAKRRKFARRSALLLVTELVAWLALSAMIAAPEADQAFGTAQRLVFLAAAVWFILASRLAVAEREGASYRAPVSAAGGGP